MASQRWRVTTVLGAALVLSGMTGLGVALAAPGYAPVQRTNIDRPVPPGATLLPSGRLVSPAGRASTQGDFPLGVAVSPDGRLAATSQVGQGEGIGDRDYSSLCLDGQKMDRCGAARGLPGNPGGAPDEQLLITDLVTGAQRTLRAPQTACKPDPSSPHPPGGTRTSPSCFELGVVFAPDGRTLYDVGGGNDAVYAFPVSADDVVGAIPLATYLGGPLPPTGGRSDYSAPSGSGAQARRTKGLAITPDGSTLLVSEEQSGSLDVLDARTLGFQGEVGFAIAEPGGAAGPLTYPYQVVATDRTAYVSLQGTDAVAAVPLVPRAGVGLTPGVPVISAYVGDHPTGLALSPDAATLAVADANDDTVALLDVRSPTPTVTARVTTHAKPGEVVGSVPDAVAWDGPDRLYVALAGDDAVAVLTRQASGLTLSGLVPTGWYPTSVAVRPGTGELVALAAKGLGSHYPPGGEYAPPAAGGPQAVLPGYYDANNIPGLLSVVPRPGADLAASTATVRRNLDFPAAGVAGLPHGSVPVAAGAGSGPITHVVYIVRENRTYDQEYGDLARTRNDSDADPSFESLASATPQGHAITGRFASSDSFFSDGEASVQGHWWTSSANTDDYVEKSYRQYYSARQHANDTISSPAAGPPRCSLFQAALAKSAADRGFTWKDYGEPVGTFNPDLRITIPGLPSVSIPTGSASSLTCAPVPAANADLSNFADFAGLDDRRAAQRFLLDNGLAADGSPAAGSAATLRSLSYVELPGDHTTGYTKQGFDNLEGHTPRAQVAENDAAVGQIVSALSRSSYWSSTAVFVIEDDSQDGPDHVDGHRNVLLLASPYARQQSGNGCYGGFISHTHHDQADVVRTIELLLGLPALSAYDSQAAPLYDLFQNKATAGDLSAADLAPFVPAPDAPFIDEKVGDPSGPQGQHATELLRLSAALDLSSIDRAGPALEGVLWGSTTSRPEPASLAAAASRATSAGGPAARAAAGGESGEGGGAAAPSLAGRFTAGGPQCTPTAGGPPPAVVPEAGRAIGLPLAALAAGLGLLAARRTRRSGRSRL